MKFLFLYFIIFLSILFIIDNLEVYLFYTQDFGARRNNKQGIVSLFCWDGPCDLAFALLLFCSMIWLWSSINFFWVNYFWLHVSCFFVPGGRLPFLTFKILLYFILFNGLTKFSIFWSIMQQLKACAQLTPDDCNFRS